MNLLSPLFLSLLALNAHAEPAASQKAPRLVIACQAGSSMESEDQGCEDNAVFSRAGQACLANVEAAIKEKSGAVALAMAASNLAHTGNGANAQSANFAGSAADYALSVAALEDLIRAAKAARAVVASLPNHIYYPEDFDAPEEVIGDPIQFLDNQSCYDDARKSLEKSLAKLDSNIADLEKSRQAASARGKTSAGHESDTTSLNNAASPTAGKQSADPALGRPGLPRYSGESGPGKSDISGTKDKNKK